MKINSVRVVAFLLLIALSVGFGFAYDGIATAIEKKRNPQLEHLKPFVKSVCEEYAVPEWFLWGLMKVESDLNSQLISDDGEIGLLQISEDRYRMIYETVFDGTVPETDLLFSPKENLRVGAAYLSFLFDRYGVWQVTLAAYEAGTDRIDEWIADPNHMTATGKIKMFPDKKTEDFTNSVLSAVETYTKLYYAKTK